MSFRKPDDEIWYDMTLMDMWRGVAYDIFMDGFLAAGGTSETNDENSITLMAQEFFRTSEIYRLRGPLSLSSESYRTRYNRLQSHYTYTSADKELWVDTIWHAVVEKVADVVSKLEYHQTSWLPDSREMYHLHPNIVMGMLWAIAHIPNENERNQANECDSAYESDG